jgi:uncharacterized low-complexity protein
MSQNKKPVAVAIGAALAGGLVLSGSAFAMTSLAQGYMLASTSADAAKAPEGSCGGHKDGHEGSCGMDKMDADKDGRISRTEFAAAHDGKDDKFAAHDPNGDGFISAEEMKAHHDAERGDKAKMEGKCGEGKCGGM